MCFDASQYEENMHLSPNYVIMSFVQTKFVLMHHKISQHEENSTLAITAYITSKKIGFDASHNVPTYRK